MKKAFPIAFCALFFAACLFFFAGVFFPPPDAAAEGRELAAFPSWTTEAGAFNSRFFTELDAYFSDRFTFRQRLISLSGRVRETVFRTGSEQVIVGRNGMLFYAATAPDFTGDARMTKEEIAAAAAALAKLSDYASEHGARFLVAVAPNKNTIYPENMPVAYRRTAEATNLDALLGALAEAGVNAVDLREALSGQDVPIYHSRDTHWNGEGARLAYDAMLNAAGLPHESYAGAPLITAGGFSGDLDEMLYPGDGRLSDDCRRDVSFEGKFVYTSAYATAMDLSITTRGAGEGRLLMFRDSFGSRLIPYLSAAFAEARYERATPYRIDLLKTYPADLVIVEIAERNIPALVSAADRLP